MEIHSRGDARAVTRSKHLLCLNGERVVLRSRIDEESSRLRRERHQEDSQSGA